jgi:hypothetical protein
LSQAYYFIAAGAVMSGNGWLQITEHYLLGRKRKWCSCIGRNHKLAVSYAFGNSLVVHSRVLIASKMVKWMGAVAFRWPYSLVFHPFNEETCLERLQLSKVYLDSWAVITSIIRITCSSVFWKSAYMHMDPCLIFVFLIKCHTSCLLSML